MSDMQIDMKALRKRLGWNQARIARYLGIDQSKVSRMERSSAEPKGAVLIALKVLSEAEKTGSAETLCPELPAEAAA